MKKWSIISSLVVVAAVAVMAFAVTGAASAGNYQPYCPTGEEGTPPNCHKPGGGGGTTEPPKTCSSGQVGTYPNCVTPVLSVGGIQVNPKSSTLTFKVNAPGKVKISGKGIEATTVSVKAGKVKIKVKLTPKEQKLLKKKGKLSLKVTITYTPKGGTPITKTVKITVKSPSSKGHKGHK